MKKTVLIIASLVTATAFAQTKNEPVAVKTTPNPVVAPASDAKAVTPVKSEKPAVKNKEKAVNPASAPAAK